MAESILGKLPKQNIDKRRELIRHLHYTGLSIPFILERLEKHDFLFSYNADYDEKYTTIALDIAAIRKEAMESIAIDDFEVRAKHAEYIDRQQFLYNLAIQDGQLNLARTLSMDLGKAYGVDVETPIKVSVNIMDHMKKVTEMAQKRISERKLIDITPQETISETPVIKIPAEAILHKR